ncbi:4-methyl-5(b-hydroxyethyl)-thiazole monophosphate biosynthesis [Ruminococcaceae bacterium YRB3002]|nr:4-methyl-5(b-hydroxyethyl)-thiazole monophosphate biosynthesis [Ruminococcaceae bacterium YRB3002]
MTKKAALFIADGSEEVEAITPVDLLRRAKIEVDVVSIMPSLDITASRGVLITADKHIGDIDFGDYDILILPGGVKGTNYLNSCELLKEKIVKFNEQGKGIAAICAAPTVFSGLGLLKGKNATCNPGFWDQLKDGGAILDENSKAVTCGNIITSQAMGTSVDFGLAIVAYLCGEEAASELKANIRF